MAKTAYYYHVWLPASRHPQKSSSGLRVIAYSKDQIRKHYGLPKLEIDSAGTITKAIATGKLHGLDLTGKYSKK